MAPSLRYLTGIFLLISPLYFTHAATLSQCEKAAIESSSTHLIITMEGLFGGSNGRAAALARRARGTSSGAAILPYAYTGSASAAQCVAIWKEHFGSRLKVTVIGHSFGGGIGAMKLAEKLAAAGTRINNLITYDARSDGSNYCADDANKTRYTKPANVSNVTNFYECGGGLQGRKFEEGPGVRNIRIEGTHLNLPSNPTAQSIVAGIIGGTGGYRTGDAEDTVTAPLRSKLNTERMAWCFRMGGAVRYRCTYKEASRGYDNPGEGSR